MGLPEASTQDLGCSFDQYNGHPSLAELRCSEARETECKGNKIEGRHTLKEKTRCVLEKREEDKDLLAKGRGSSGHLVSAHFKGLHISGATDPHRGTE